MLIGASPLHAATLRVPTDFPKIQTAVDAAHPGDIVLVDAGTYRERVRLKDKVSLRSARDDSAGKIGLARAEGMPPLVMVFEGATALFSNNTIRGGGVAAIRVAGTVRVTGNRIEGTAVRKGGPPNFGVWALPGARVEMTGNTVSGWRHALSAEDAVIDAHDNSVADALGAAFRVRGKPEANLISGNHISGENVKEVLFDADAR
jgi:hypothetical protein